MTCMKWTALIVISAALIGCGKTKKTDSGKTNEPEPKPKSKPLKEKVVGKWKSETEFDDAKIKKMMEAQKVPAAKMKEAVEGFKKQMSSFNIVVEVKADGTYVVTGGAKKPINGKWELVSEEGNVLKLKATDEGKEPHTLTLTFKGDDEYGFATDDPEFNEAPFKTPIKFNRVTE